MDNLKLKELESRLSRLEDAVFVKSKSKLSLKKETEAINFDLNPRAYISRFAGDKSGPKKFVLVVAYLSKGNLNVDVTMSEIKSMWAKMSTKKLLGKYNDFYPNEAKTKGWVDTKEHGSYQLTNEWKSVI